MAGRHAVGRPLAIDKVERVTINVHRNTKDEFMALIEQHNLAKDMNQPLLTCNGALVLLLRE